MKHPSKFLTLALMLMLPLFILPYLTQTAGASSSLLSTNNLVNGIIIDNDDPGFSTTYVQDAWQEYTEVGGQHYGDTHFYNRTIGTGQDIATWSFNVPQPGQYDVYAWWWEGSWRPTDVPYTINYLDGNATVKVNQQSGGGQWNLLGTYYFQDDGSVTVSDNVSAGQDIVADAIRLVYHAAAPEDTPTPAPTSNPGTISLTLDGPAAVTTGQTFALNVVAHSVPTPGVYGTQFEINYNPALVSVSNLQLNPNFSFVVLNNADNTAGKIKVVASQQGRVSGLSGDVTLLSFDAHALLAGNASFTFDNQKMSDFQAQGFDMNSATYSVTIADTATPEPTNTPTPESPISPLPTPTSQPTLPPTAQPTVQPTSTPTPQPTNTPLPTAEPTNTPLPTAEPTGTPLPTDEPTPAVADISGQIIAIGRTGNDWSGSTVSIASSNPQTTLTDVTGSFQLTEIPTGMHTFTADAPGYLSAVCADVTITTATTLESVNLLSGDINDDDLVDITDATAVGADFGRTGNGLAADITRDNVIDIFDIVLVSVNFGEQGPQPWVCLAD